MLNIPGLTRRASIFTPPTDVLHVHTCQNGNKIGRHKSVEDYVCEFADGTLSNGFGRKLALSIIAKDTLTRLNIPIPKKIV